MPTIRILSDRVANQIAAGEVIERPAAVVKELVENALDAGATRIEVGFRHGGRSLIRVTDNGGGMTQDDALLALERHATSKIVETADLDRLDSFGFRGEALPSIASIARFELQTRRAEDAAGTEVVVNGGKLVHVRECGAAPGTRITVTHLFHAVPARRKFLKSDATESAHIIQNVRLYALACPQTAFTLIEDDRVLFRSPVCPTLAERVAEILGRQLAADLLPVEAEEEGLRLSGLLGRPGVHRAARHELITFVNRRPVDSRTLNYALIESYTTLLPKGRYPVAVLFLELDPAAVDVNVHPAKREVRFRNEGQVRGFVIRHVLQKLRESGAPAPVAEPVAEAGRRNAEWRAALSFPAASPAAVAPAVIANVPAPFPASAPPVADREAPFAHPPVAPPSSLRGPPTVPSRPPPGPASQLSDWRFLGTAHTDYALFESPAGVVVLDRRAAHERVWFERLQAQFARREVASQRLLFALPVELDVIASALLVDKLAFLAAHGLEVGEFGRNFFRIEAVPTWLEPEAAEQFLRDVLALVREGRLDERDPRLAEEELARLAALKAVRLPETTTAADALILVTQLFACLQPHSSPAGRPTHFELGRGELARRFQR
ncbi:MAG: DNA mismatch repair endonuclease MutL [Opitutales bacterium]